MFFQIIIFLLIGLLTGALSGLTGVSGGVITIPCLFAAFMWMDFSHSYVMQVAIATSLTSMVFNSFISFLTHAKKKAVFKTIITHMSIGIILGSFFGAFIAQKLSTHILQKIFGSFEVLAGIFIFIFRKEPKEFFDSKKHLINETISGLIMSFVSALLGVGGGFIAIPYFLYRGFPIKIAIGTGAGISFFITFLGAIGHLYFGWEKTAVPYSIGILYLPAFITISLSSMLAAPGGAYLAHYLPNAIVKKVFAACLVIAGILMLF